MDQERLSQVIDILTQVSDLLYQENIEYAYKMLAIILKELEEVISMVKEETVRIEMKEKLMGALQAMEERDYILLADIIQYEVVEHLKMFEDQ